jgi:hypothetical protein
MNNGLSRDAAGNLLLNGQGFAKPEITQTGIQYDPRQFGTEGVDIENANRATSPYYMRVDQPGQDGPAEYRLKPEYEQALAGQVQMGAQTGSGGWGEAMSDEDLRYDPRFGLTAARERIKDPETNVNARWRHAAEAAIAAAAGGAVMADMGMFAGAADPSAGLSAEQIGTGGSTALPDAGASTLDLTNVGAGQGFGLESPYSLGPNAPDLSTITGPVEQVTANPILDPIRDWATRLSAGVPAGGGAMPSAGGNIFGIEGLSNGDLLNYGSRLAGTFLNNNAATANREMTAAEAQANRDQQLLLAMVNQETPYGSVEYSRDPVTGAIRRRATMNEADQHNLDLRRGIQAQVGEGTYKPMYESDAQHWIDLAMGGRQMNPRT